MLVFCHIKTKTAVWQTLRSLSLSIESLQLNKSESLEGVRRINAILGEQREKGRGYLELPEYLSCVKTLDSVSQNQGINGSI